MCATNKHIFSYQEVSSILQNGEEKPYMPIDTGEGEGDDHHIPISHDNIRGRAYFAVSDKENKNNHNPQSKNNGNKR